MLEMKANTLITNKVCCMLPTMINQETLFGKHWLLIANVTAQSIHPLEVKKMFNKYVVKTKRNKSQIKRTLPHFSTKNISFIHICIYIFMTCQKRKWNDTLIHTFRITFEEMGALKIYMLNTRITLLY